MTLSKKLNKAVVSTKPTGTNKAKSTDPVTFKGEDLFDAYILLRSIVGDNCAKHVPLRIEGDKITVAGINPQTGVSAFVWLPCTNPGSEKKVNIDFDVLSSALRQAKEVSLTFNGDTEAFFRSGQRYSGSLTLAPFGEWPDMPTVTSPINRESMTFFAANNKKVRLTEALNLDVTPATFLFRGPKGTVLLCFDQAHSAFVYTKEHKSAKEEIVLAVTNSVLPVLDKVMEGDSARMWFTETQMVAENDKCRASFAKFSPANEHHSLAIKYFFANYPNEGGASFFDLKEINRVIGSLSSFSDGHTPAVATLGSRGLTIEIKSSHFSGKDTVDVNGDAKGTWSFIEASLADSLSLLETNLETRLVPVTTEGKTTHFWLIQNKDNVRYAHLIRTLSD